MNGTLLVTADIEQGSGLRSVDHDGRPGVRAFRFLGDMPILSLIEDIRLRLLRLPRRSLRNAERFLARFFQRLYANLNEGLDLRAITRAIGADGFVPDFRKEQRVIASPFRTRGATPCCREELFIACIEGSVDDVEKNFPL